MHGSGCRGMVMVLLSLVLSASAAHAYLALLRQGTETSGHPEPGDRFGYALAVGDFNGDGYDDLATGTPQESNSLDQLNNHGVVHVNLGGPFGLTRPSQAELSRGEPLDPSVRYGNALAAGDFNGDGLDDLAIGAPSEDYLGTTNTGGVWIYDGWTQGVQNAPSALFYQSGLSLLDEANDLFGWSRATGDINGDGYDDLLVGAIGEDGNTGMVVMIPGSSGGLDPAGRQVITPASFGYSAAAGGWFGYSIGSGDLDLDGYDDVVIGAPMTDVGAVTEAGRVYVVYGSPGGLTTIDAWQVDHTHPLNQGLIPAQGARLGWALTVGHFTDRGSGMSFAAGLPYLDYGMYYAAGGVVSISYADSTRAPQPGWSLFREPSSSISNREANDHFGWSIASGDHDGDGYDDLAFGGPDNNVQESAYLGVESSTGSVGLLMGGQNGFSSTALLTSIDFNDHVNANDHLGWSLAMGDFDGNGSSALCVGAPDADYEYYDGSATTAYGAGQVYIYAPWRQPVGRPHRSSAALDCEGDLVYAKRAWQRLRPASTTKTMTLLLACEAIANGQDPDQVFFVPQWVATQVGGSQVPLYTGESMTFRDLLKVMMTVSGNDAAMMLGAIMSGEGNQWNGWEGTSPSFAQTMENRAAQLGMSSSTSFTNAAGIDAGDHYVTAYDFALFVWNNIQNSCVREIVSTSPWMVQRNLPAGQWGGFILSPDPIQTVFYNGFVDNVRKNLSSANGNKGGDTPGALATGVFNCKAPLPSSGYTAASAFGFWRGDEPLEGVKRVCNTCTGAALLAAAANECDAVNDLVLPNPDPPQTPWGTLTDASSYSGDPPVGMVITGTAEEETSDLTIQIDLLRRNYQNPTASVGQIVTRISEFVIPPGASRTVGIQPYQQHYGFHIVNRDSMTVSLLVTATDPTGSTWTANLATDQALDIPPSSGAAAPSFSLTILNQSTPETATLEVEEIGYLYDVTLGDGVTAPDVFTVGLTRSHRPAQSRLHPPYPNPFNPHTVLRFDLRIPGQVDLAIYDLRGRRVKTLIAGVEMESGRYQRNWNGRDDRGRAVASGIYLVRLSAPGIEQSQRLTLLK